MQQTTDISNNGNKKIARKDSRRKVESAKSSSAGNLKTELIYTRHTSTYSSFFS